MFAFFHILGTIPFAIDSLKMKVSGSAIAKAKSRNVQLGMLSGPDALRTLLAVVYRTLRMR